MDGDAATIAPTPKPAPGGRIVAGWRRRVAAATWAAVAEMAARLGYMARGVVYLSTGFIALLAVARVVPHTHSPIVALEQWARWPLGVVLLWLTGVGLYGFAGWRA